MKKFKAGDKVKIIDCPKKEYIGCLGTLTPVFGFDHEEDDVFVTLDNGEWIMVKEHQVEKE